MNNDKLREGRATEFLTQAKNQISANDFRNFQTGLDYPIDWHFNDEETADFAWDLFRRNGYLDKIRVFYTPKGTHTSERLTDY